MIKRDKRNYIGQHNADYPDYFDMGDTARSTGLMAMAGSELDQFLIWDLAKWDEHNKNLKLARHPDDIKWSDYKLMSRDQVLCVAAGFYRRQSSTGYVIREAIYNYIIEKRVNKDVLLPHHRLSLSFAIRRKPSLWLKLTGYPLMLMHIFYNSWIVSDSEQNQTIAMLSVLPSGWLKLFCKLHPDINANLSAYWCGYPWRDQSEIKDQIIHWLTKEGYL